MASLGRVLWAVPNLRTRTWEKHRGECKSVDSARLPWVQTLSLALQHISEPLLPEGHALGKWGYSWNLSGQVLVRTKIMNYTKHSEWIIVAAIIVIIIIIIITGSQPHT